MKLMVIMLAIAGGWSISASFFSPLPTLTDPAPRVITRAAGMLIEKPIAAMVGYATGYTYGRLNRSIEIPQRFRRQVVSYVTDEPVGTIVVDTQNKFLYLVQEDNTALRYGISVGRAGEGWNGRVKIARKAPWPTWTPTRSMREKRPDLPRRVSGGPHNPMGARALYLYQNGHDTLYRIHGTNQPRSIGKNVSAGCFRLTNSDIKHLYKRVRVGAEVVVLPETQQKLRHSIIAFLKQLTF